MFIKSKKGQLSVYILIAVLIVAAVGVYFLVVEKSIQKDIPAEFEPVQASFLGCIETNAKIGAEILGERGGYIYTPDFEPGSEFMPFSNQLDFFGQPVPYWYYVSQNNIIKEQKPSKKDMENELERFLEERISLCDFSDFEKQGYFISLEESEAEVSIRDNQILVQIGTLLTISDLEQTAQVKIIETQIDSKLGKFYDLAEQIYNKEKQDMFLESYGVDALRLYLPVDGVELSCSPKIWNLGELKTDLEGALSANVQALKVKGDYYEIKDSKNQYFVVDVDSDEAVRFLYSPNWPTRLEAEPNEGGILIAEPVGLQQGLGILGFCYVPYHFVYDVVYPVMIQVYDEDELFQYPVSVVIDNNVPREALPGTTYGEEEVPLCEYRNQEVKVYTYDSSLNPVEADIDFVCLEQSCTIGRTKIQGKDAVLSDVFPQCVNGYVIAKANDYEISEYKISTNYDAVANILMDKLYEQDFSLELDNVKSDENAIIYFESGRRSKTIIWPEDKTIKLSEGQYNVSVYVYTSEQIEIPATSTEKCVDVPKGGFFGYVGMTEEKCFTIDFPEQILSAGIIGGGKSPYYVTESELRKGRLEIRADKFGVPSSLEELQDNYNKLDVSGVELRFS